MNEQQQYNCIF